MRALNVGAGFAENPEIRGLGEIEFVRLDGNTESKPDIVHDIRDPMPDELVEAFDVVVASHVLEHISWRTAMPTLANIVKAIKPGGFLILVVPDIEWACRKILNGTDDFDLGVIGVLWGGQHDELDYHRCGFTLQAARMAVQKVGLVITQSGKNEFKCIMLGKEFFPDEIRIVAEKPK